MTENAVVKASDVNVDEIGRIGKMLALSGYFESANNLEVAVAQMATKVLAGREMGFGPFASANGIHIIKGKPGVGANLMASAVKSHPRYDYRVREMSTTVCKLEFFERADSGEWESIGVSEFTEADAKAAGTQNMQKYARNMLFARAMSNGVRWFCPDVFNGNSVYVPEELGANVDGDGNVIDAGYTVHKPQTTNGTHEGHADAEVVVDMAAIAEDTAGAMATPQNGNGAKPDYAVMFADESIAFSDAAVAMITKLREEHRTSDKPMTAKQYGFLCSLVDGVAGDNMHGAVLSCIFGTDVSSANIPGYNAKSLIDWLKSDNETTLAKTKAAIGEIAAKCRELA